MSTAKLVVTTLTLTYIVTSVHHAYGAWLYNTLWRNHIIFQGGLCLVVALIFLGVYEKWAQKWAYLVFFIISFLFFFVAIGLYEGFYNHILKNILYFSGVQLSVLMKLYPPPTYEMPDDWLFELSGIFSFFIAMFTGKAMIQHFRSVFFKK